MDLPTELVENIAYSLPLSDLRNFRLTCSSMRDQALHPFKDRFFRRRTITVTADSLKGLIDVAGHPQIGSALRDLVIDATPQLEKKYTDCQRRIRDAQLDDGLRQLLDIELRLINEDRVKLSDFAKSGQDRKLLALAFMVIGRLHSIAFAYDGFNESEAEDAMYHLRRAQTEMSRPFVSTIAAIAFSGLAVEEITVQNHRRSGFVSIGKLKFSSTQYSQLRPALAHLRVLKLDLRDWLYAPARWMVSVEIPPFVARFLSRVTELRELDLSCHIYSSRKEDVFTEIANMVRLPHLVKCTLGLILAKEENLLRFLQASKTSLKHLTLRNCVIVTGCWRTFLESLANTIDLERLTLDNLYENEHVALLGNDKIPAVDLERPGLKEKILSHARGYELSMPLPYFQYFWDDAVRA